ncbi:MAG: VanZ family protein [Candidatus Omnitrophica bacterium]|nr:VanZ family protein [Candidatus Omnitrophota bacterium]MBU4478773.1 VanZ family protein [Candidatus Omnitrophota bacterium]MCG2704176.1 VanZ family protein [Candidatus Omnitrophota bacterium]
MSKKFRYYWLPVFVWAALIFSVSSISRFPEKAAPLFSCDKLAHMIEYAILAFLLARAFRNSDSQTRRKNFRILAVICAIVYGLSDELHQYFVPLRTPSAFDWLFDSIGAFLGPMVYREKIISNQGEESNG